MPMGDDSYWILSLGAFGIVIGLALYGYKILHALGGRFANDPVQRYLHRVGAAMVIIMGSRLGWRCPRLTAKSVPLSASPAWKVLAVLTGTS